MNEQSRINAMISYLFLGPIFLIAKSDTPLGDPYVQGHAKKASSIIGLTILAVLIYAFLLKDILNFSIPIIGIHIHTVLLTIIVGTCMSYLLLGAYKAFHGVDSLSTGGISRLSFSIETSSDEIIGEENKIRLLAGMLPFLGMYLSQKYNHPIMIRARILGSFFTFLVITSFYITTSDSFLSLLIISLYILFIVIEGVYIFVGGKFLRISFLEKIPSYQIIEAYIIASVKYSYEFVKIIFGGNHKQSFQELLNLKSSESEVHPPNNPYIMPVALLAVPFWNLLAIPSLFIEKYKEYKNIIIQSLLVSLILGYVMFILGHFSDPILLFLLFPIFHIAFYSNNDLNTKTPGIGLLLGVFGLFKNVQNTIQSAQSINTEEKFTYEVKE